ncbi:glucose-6-phosphate dehydrogenase [Dermatophilus congolensis]|uniref:Glucose-6-phosphate 1-dehydrogenase n=1 Tax=Dermatophilus congolensis TaxID=1863 RepID=A0A239VBA5_9MICO|nr:glucose-6-phosphate dehydrogenase [Dermatophilus congolensis]MBO3130563.1 glucose-6-phosphate dehydrogenase [Dermatophilus congolensis]MBO3130807.1 glucose-6-phosphate dehydrogenase [Dermatophilus congolensis]MBO3135036.1 glucose-6-phosphate dehydrogenase [Dermatophilus congolensis]MBO3137275.1 glucose-6-phosphate dehydrogenase [Dermatophilus congolensis]MBO3139519.1 glucose-6-phosphate dehydrogenase [Dermatophilus congolensis]
MPQSATPHRSIHEAGTDSVLTPRDAQRLSSEGGRSPRVNLLILGASGDLTRRLLLPGLGTLLLADPERRVRILGAAADDLSDEEWRLRVLQALAEGGCGQRGASRLAERSSYTKVDLLSSAAVRDLIAELGNEPAIIYFALPPRITHKVLEVLATIGIGPNIRLGLEKPFGNDLQTARELNELLHSFADESQIYRVDHFLGRSGVLNLLGFRFANRVFEPLWNCAHIESVDIIFDESLALEGRAAYYDHAGALIDMIQSHLLLMLALTAMEDLSRIEALELRDLQTHLLRCVSLWNEDPAQSSRRARYSAGVVEGKKVPAYVDEKGVNPDNMTETLAEVTVRINNERWAGVPFRLRSGKALGKNDRRIVLHFKPVGHLPTGFGPAPGANTLTISLSPEELQLDIATNGSGDKFKLERSRMTAVLGESAIRPYGEILGHIMDGDQLLSVRGDTAEEMWRILTPVVEAWRNNEVPMHEYSAGTHGPDEWDTFA